MFSLHDIQMLDAWPLVGLDANLVPRQPLLQDQHPPLLLLLIPRRDVLPKIELLQEVPALPRRQGGLAIQLRSIWHHNRPRLPVRAACAAVAAVAAVGARTPPLVGLGHDRIPHQPCLHVSIIAISCSSRSLSSAAPASRPAHRAQAHLRVEDGHRAHGRREQHALRREHLRAPPPRVKVPRRRRPRGPRKPRRPQGGPRRQARRGRGQRGEPAPVAAGEADVAPEPVERRVPERAVGGPRAPARGAQHGEAQAERQGLEGEPRGREVVARRDEVVSPVGPEAEEGRPGVSGGGGGGGGEGEDEAEALG
ncbi:uncharacterized protein E0L32_009602 [Thyridium curvatum]|uniref:Uncharacterized protein n=1 Tax=Thyridium curvatum TaxID=1093900 RepID=A0A507AVM9_9PEZI|nr:uncharacterized protein E0L32_009602 [Thyridium curvatum]TPX08898.1 hypothetical protein E0L32_009602 [Thyridium curvatum]